MSIKKVILASSAALALVIVAAGVLLAQNYRSAPTYSARIELAQKYFSQGNYDKAILEYQTAIKMDAHAEEAYLGLALVYRTQGFYQLAGEILQNGLNMTENGVRIQSQLAMYYPELVKNTIDDTEDPKKETGSGGFAVDEDLLRFLATACYADYVNKFSGLRAETGGGRCVLRVDAVDADIVFHNTDSNQVLNSNTGYPYNEFQPNEIVLDNIISVFGGVSVVTYENLKNLSAVSQLRRDGTTIIFMLFGCRFTVSCDETGSIHPYANNQIEPTGVAASTGNHTLLGLVLDAASGKPVSGAELKFYVGFSTSGDYASAISDHNGSYSVSVEGSGNYSVVISKIGYIEETFQIYVTGAGNEARNNFTISPQLASDEIRIVLTWGSLPSDLDSHLNGTASDGTLVSVSYSSKTAYNRSSQKVAELDVDDRSSYGPETTTISDANGTYYFDVVDYTNSIGVGMSDATVKIYRGNTLLHSVKPDSGVGLGWRVCKIDHGNVVVLNQEIQTSGGRPVL